jgi:hypothetical protein
MLEEEGFEWTGDFCAYHCQMRSLILRPWECPPVWVHDPDDPFDGERPNEMSRRLDSAGLLKRMLSHGISRYEPDPEGALRMVESV